ncbi:MAG: hypothetical protein AMDU4_FER2C00162G0003 [Ferroplasma sp. Type II]|nr:MAG: hypothetical protein AMDU4_FER2C00162G0003 [Ferroplasma sp. Type II]
MFFTAIVPAIFAVSIVSPFFTRFSRISFIVSLLSFMVPVAIASLLIMFLSVISIITLTCCFHTKIFMALHKNLEKGSQGVYDMNEFRKIQGLVGADKI